MQNGMFKILSFDNVNWTSHRKITSIDVDSIDTSCLAALCFLPVQSSTVPESSGWNGHELNMAFKRSNMDISSSTVHGARLKLTSVFGAPNLVKPDVRSRWVVCLIPIVISGRFGSRLHDCKELKDEISKWLVVDWSCCYDLPPLYKIPSAGLSHRWESLWNPLAE